MSTSWPMTSLDQVLRERREIPDDLDVAQGNVPIVSKIGFNDGKMELRREGGSKTNMILVMPGDLLVSGINAAKGAIAIYGEENKGPAAATIHYGAYEVVKEKADVKYLWWYLRSSSFRNILLDAVPGGIKTELKASRLLPIEIPLPPVDEQRRIMEWIEALATKYAEARTIQHQVCREINVLMRSLISYTTMEASPSGQLSDVLLEPPRNGWSPHCDNASKGVPVLTLSAVTGFRYNSTAFKLTSEPTTPHASYWLERGDLLMTRSNTEELVGHVAIYDGMPCPCIYPDLMMRLSINEKIADKKFVWMWLQTNIVREFIAKNARGTNPTMKKVSQGTVMEIPFPTEIPIHEQREVVSYVEKAQENIEQLVKIERETRVELEALIPSILDKAFKGKL